MTFSQIAASRDVDRAKVVATTEADIRRHMIEDGEHRNAPFSAPVSVPPLAALRERVGLSQAKFARALRIPAATLRNWEQGRTQPNPVALSFFALVNDDPDRAFKVLAK